MKRLLLFCQLLFIPVTAMAGGPPALEVRAALGASHYLHGDLDYTAPTGLFAVRFGVGPLAVEPEFALAQHTRKQVFGMAEGTSQQATTVTTDRFRSAAVNILGRWGSSVSAYAGGGPGWYWERDSYRVDAPAGGYEQNSTRGPRPGAQLVAGVDVPVASRIKAFGQFRYEMRSFEDPGGGSVVQGMGGVSIALR